MQLNLSELSLLSNFSLMGLFLGLPAKRSLRQQNDRTLSSC